ncbi:chaperonin 10, mitochondrial [Pelomyxa schiedti]|nr:chaperonin 10, mitochondrial [Pelomyxa schiedti]
MSMSLGGSSSFIISQFRPMFDRVLVRKLEPTTTKQVGHIVLPDTAQESLQQGVVVAVGSGHKPKDGGKSAPMTVKKGDKVLLSEYGGQSFKVDNDKYGIYKEDDILCVIGDNLYDS